MPSGVHQTVVAHPETQEEATPQASARVHCPATMAVGSQAQMLAIPVTTTFLSGGRQKQGRIGERLRHAASPTQGAL